MLADEVLPHYRQLIMEWEIRALQEEAYNDDGNGNGNDEDNRAAVHQEDLEMTGEDDLPMNDSDTDNGCTPAGTPGRPGQAAGGDELNTPEMQAVFEGFLEGTRRDKAKRMLVLDAMDEAGAGAPPADGGLQPNGGEGFGVGRHKSWRESGGSSRRSGGPLMPNRKPGRKRKPKQQGGNHLQT